MYLFKAHPAKQAAMRYKMKLMTARGVVKARPTPKAMVMICSLSLKRKEKTPATSSTSYETSREQCYCAQAAEGMRAKSC